MTPVELVRLSLVVIHVCGLAAIVGSLLAQLARARGFRFTAMFAGAIVQLVSGVLLVAVRRAADLPVAGPKIGVKAAVTVAILVTALVAVLWQRRLARAGRSDSILRPLLYGIGIAAIANIVIAVFWT